VRSFHRDYQFSGLGQANLTIFNYGTGARWDLSTSALILFLLPHKADTKINQEKRLVKRQSAR
jgi:hypothetical protein